MGHSQLIRRAAMASLLDRSQKAKLPQVNAQIGQVDFVVSNYACGLNRSAVLRAYTRWAELDQDRFRGYSGGEIRNGDESMSTQKPGTKQTQFSLGTRRR